MVFKPNHLQVFRAKKKAEAKHLPIFFITEMKKLPELVRKYDETENKDRLGRCGEVSK